MATRAQRNPARLASITLLLAAIAGGCSDSPPDAPDGGDAGTDTDTDSDTDADTDSDAGADAGADPLDEFFSLAAIHEVEIEVSDAGVAALIAAPATYVHGSVRIDDVYYEDVGVRLKGGWGSFVPLDADYQVGNGTPGKSAFIVKFNEYVPGQKHLGLPKLTINNNVQDNSYIHQYVGYTLFRRVGVPACRAGFGTVSFNGTEKGLYTLVEPTDNHALLDRWYGNHDGTLYEGTYGVDLNVAGVPGYDQDNGVDTTRQDLTDLVAALDAIPDGADPLPTLQALFDFDEYLRFAATELYIGQWDGYAWWINNYYVHHDLAGGEWTFLPWDLDQPFGDGLGAYSGVMQAPGPAWGDAAGFGDARIQMLCFRSPACLERLRDAFVEVLDAADAMDLRGLAEQTWAAVSDAALAETTEWGDPTTTIYAAADTSAFIVNRREAIERWLPCLVGGEVDNDGDGYDGCTVDCDDWNASTYPGAPEACDGVDNDCSGVIDDNPECPTCTDLAAPDGRTYSVCSYVLSWDEAEAFCEVRGQKLAAVHDAETMASLATEMSIGMGYDDAWIGLTDAAAEGTFVWADGSPVDFTAWAAGEPGAGGDYTDCALNGAGGWADAPCGDAHAFFCKSIPDCPPGEVWDAATDACLPWECTVEDLGTFAGVPIYAEGDTCGGTSIFADGDVNCTGWNAAERELLYTLVVPAGDTVTITMTPTGDGSLDSSLYLLTECLDFGREGCLVGSDVTYGGEPETVVYTNDTGADLLVYVVADAYSGCGTFQLSVI